MRTTTGAGAMYSNTGAGSKCKVVARIQRNERAHEQHARLIAGQGSFVTKVLHTSQFAGLLISGRKPHSRPAQPTTQRITSSAACFPLPDVAGAKAFHELQQGGGATVPWKPRAHQPLTLRANLRAQVVQSMLQQH